MIRLLRLTFGLAVVAAGLGIGYLGYGRSRSDDSDSDSSLTPPYRVTLDEIGERLSERRSIAELNSLVNRGDRLLAELSTRERRALGRGLMRIHVDMPVIVWIVADPRFAPFWLGDRGFLKADWTLTAGGVGHTVYSKRFRPGWIELGVNALDRRAESHYAVVVAPNESGRDLMIKADDSERRPIVRMAEGVSLYRDKFVPVDIVPKALETGSIVQTMHDERHAAVLFRGSAWKTHVPSQSTPDQIVMQYGKDASRSLIWTWRTKVDSMGSVLRVGERVPGRETPPKYRQIYGESWTYGSRGLVNDPTARRHRAAVDDLKAGTVYQYSLGDGSPFGWSPWRTIKTGPSSDSGGSFMYLGDAQNGFEAWGKMVANAVSRHPEVGFVAIAGDLVDRGNERTNWDHFFLRGAAVFDRLPLLPCVGNHEYLDEGPRLYRSFFRPPENGPKGIDAYLVYAVEYAGAFLAVLDSTRALYDADSARVQAEWLDQELARTRARWKIVMFHHPVHASHPSRENPPLERAWTPMFDRRGVDLVLQGHDHAYLRTYPIRNGVVRRDEPNRATEGTVYVVSVSGDKYYDQNVRGVAAAAFTHRSTYQVIDLDGSRRLRYRSFDATGTLRDLFTIEKSSAESDQTSVVSENPHGRSDTKSTRRTPGER
jgi:3',5'-cyclic AMP phosphodiesterase CpdA